MFKILLVGCGGFIGSVFRYLVAMLTHYWIQRDDLPIATLIVNVIGCLLIGMLARLGEDRGVLTEQSRAFIIVGILGGFTTYSSFANETIQLGRNGQSMMALTNVAAQLLLGLGAVWIGREICQKIWD